MFARRGLIANPGDYLLLNNLAVALAMTERVAEAVVVFTQIDRSEAEAESPATYLATQGLLAFRSGNPQQGREHYQAAVAAARKRKNARAVVWALLHHAQEEFRYDPAEAITVLREGKEHLQKLPAGEKRVAGRILDRALALQQRLGV